MQFPPKKKLHGDCHFLYYFSKYPNTPSASKHGQAFGILPGISLCPLIRTSGKIFTIRISNKINCSVCSGVRVSAGRPSASSRPHSRCLCCNGSRGGSAHPLPEACGAGSHFRHDGYKNDTPPCGNLASCGHGAVARRCNPGWSVWRCNE